MKKQLTTFVLLFLLLGSTYAANTTAPKNATQPYCTDIFTNTHNFVNSSLYSLTTYTGLLSLSFLIILAVLLVLSLIYGIGIGFGVDSFVRFARTEYIESVFNIILLLLILGGVVFANWLPTFFSSVPSVVLPSAAVPSGANGSVSAGIYTAICNNIVSTQVIPTMGVFVLTSLIQNTYSFLGGSSITVKPNAPLSNYLPSFTFKPFAGLSLNLAFVDEQTGVIITVLGIDAAVIFLLFIIYFLFPIYLYLGIVLRSFPWTRAAGGTFIAIFVAFYIVFPAVLYPFTVASASTNGSGGLCQGASNQTSSSQNSTSQYCLTPVTSLSSFVSTAFSVLSNQGGANIFKSVGLTATIAIYATQLAFFIETLVGLFVSYLVSYELLELLGDVLGAPSLNADRLIKGVI